MASPAFKLLVGSSTGFLPFGPIPQNKPLTYVLPIKNIGSAPLIITAVNVNVLVGNAGDFFITGFTGSLTIAPGFLDLSLSITFLPTAVLETVEQATITFISNSVAGTQTFTLIGTCSNPGSITNETTGNLSVSATQSTIGGNSQTSSAGTFSASAIPAGAQISVSFTMAVTLTLSGAAGGSGYVQISVDGGTTWGTYYTLTTTSTRAFSATLPYFANLNLLQVRAGASAQVTASGGNASSTCDLTNITATVNVGGDNAVVATYLLDGTYATFPVVDFGAVTAGNTYNLGILTLVNLTASPQAVTLTFDTVNGYSLFGTVTGTNPIPSGGNLNFDLQLIPPAGGTQDDISAVTATIQGGGFSVSFEALYEAPVIVPAFTLVGDQEATVLALKTSSSASSLNAFNSSLACEDVIKLSKQYYVDQPHLNKMLNRLWLLYERLGSFVLTLVASAVNPKNVPTATDAVQGDLATDGLLQIGVFDVQVTGSCINLTYSMPANSGLLSIAGFVMKVDEGGEVIENT